MAKADKPTATEEKVANPLDAAPVQDVMEQSIGDNTPSPTVEERLDVAMRLIEEQRKLIESMAKAGTGRPPVHQTQQFVHGVPSVLKEKRTLADGTVREDF